MRLRARQSPATAGGAAIPQQAQPAEPRVREPGDHGATRLLLLCGMLLVAVNMRPALAEVGPVLGFIHADTHLAGAGLALLTTLPVLCFGLLAPLAPMLARRWGLERSLTGALLALTAGMVIRLGPGVPALLGGTLVLGGGIALTNILLPAMVKRDFSRRAGLVTGLYTTALNLAAAAAAGSAVPLATRLGAGWHGTFAFWVGPAALALLVWVPLARRAAKPPPARRQARSRGAGLARNRRAQQLVAFTTAQSVIYYGVLSWLPSIFHSHGLSATSAGFLLSVSTLVSAPVALITPALAGRRADQRGYIALIAGCAVTGLLGLLLYPLAAPYAWAALIGIAQGGAFPLALTLFVLRTRDPEETTRVSTLAQGTAYLVAAAGPLAMGLLHDQTGSWQPAVALLTALAVVEMIAGLGAGRPGYLTGSQPAAAAGDVPSG